MVPVALRRIVVRLPNWLGDALMARPALHALRAHAPAAEVRAVGPAPLLALLAADAAFDGARVWPPPGRARHQLAGSLAAWRPDLALVFPPSFSSAWFARATRARVRIGFATEARAPLLTHAPRRGARGDRHLSREYLSLLAPLGMPWDPPAPRDLPVGAEARASADTLLAARGLAEAPLAVVGPGALYGPAKRWPAERFATLGRALTARGMHVLVCGAASERATCAAVAGALGHAGTLLAGDTELPTQAALLARAAVAVCNDSGLAHLAAAVGVPTVAIFGSTSSAWTAPLGTRVRVVQRAPVCSPCFQRTCAIGYRCLLDVQVDDVLAAVDALEAP